MVTLEKIDQVVDRTGVTYAQAKKVLEENDGDVVESIIAIENGDKFGEKVKNDFNVKKDDLVSTLKEILAKGNATKIVVEKESEEYLSIPMTIAIPTGVLSLALGPILLPVIAALGVGAYVGNVTVKVIKKDGTEVNVNEETEKKLRGLKKNVDETKNKTKEKAEDIKDDYDELKEDVIDITEDVIDDINDSKDE